MNEYTVTKTDETWAIHGLRENFLAHDGGKIPYKAITKGGEFVAIVGDRYKLLANEEVQRIADETARLMGYVPFDKFTGGWFCRTDGHAFLTGENKAQAHFLYAKNEPVTLANGDTLQIGFAVHNSIDGSMGFSVGGFTFRHACSNMVFIGFRGLGMGFDDREGLAFTYHKHTATLETDPKTLALGIQAVIEKSERMVEHYREWQTQTLKLDMARKFAKALPQKYMPDYISIKAPVGMGGPKTQIELLADGKNLWEAYNDITALIWHNDKTDYQAKKQMFDNLHKVLVPRKEAR